MVLDTHGMSKPADQNLKYVGWQSGSQPETDRRNRV